MDQTLTEMAPQTVQQRTVKIGDYIVTGKVGQGGIAEIYRAKQPSLNRVVAIKMLSKALSDNPDIVKRFDRESLVIAHLNHPNIVHVIDKGIAGGRYYFVMEYVDGASLRQVIDSDKIPLNTKLEAVVQVCKGLDYAHKNGVIHRDVKPANILIDRQGNAKVTDFGIAQIVGGEKNEIDTTSSDMVMGTVAYMSPEQKISSRDVDQTTDIYATGVMIYEILCGKKPLGHFKIPSEVNPGLNKKFDEIIVKCLAQDRSDRYQSAVDLKDALLHAMGRETVIVPTEEISASSADFMGKCRYLDTIKETRYCSTILVENQSNKRLYIIKKHNRGKGGRNEAKLLATLKHKNIIGIYGSGGDNKSTTVIAEYAPGGSLTDRLAKKYDWEDALGIAIQIASGLGIAHKNNIVHGNLRPSNILFGSDDSVKLTDFGMPAHYNENEGKKNWYAPPERKSSKLGDIYSLGVILHLMITEKRPGYNMGNKLLLEDLRLMVPEAVKKMLSKLAAIRVTERYQSCEEFIADAENYCNRSNYRKSDSDSGLQSASEPHLGLPKWVYAVFAGFVILALFIGMYLGGLFK